MTSRLAALAEVCQINPKLPKPHGLSGDDEVSFVPMAAIDEISGAITNAGVRRFDEVKKGYTAFFENDVLFAKITPCMENGKAAVARNLVGGVGFGSTEFHVLRADESVLPEWLYYFVRRKAFRDEAKRNFTGTGGQQRVPATFIANARLPLPSLADQRSLVDILSRAEGIVRLRREAQKKAAELIPAIFIDMFGDPATNPKGWPIVPLGECVAAADYGCSVKASSEGSGLPMIRMGNVTYTGDLDLQDIKYAELPPDDVEKYGLREGDLLFNRTNSKELVGKTGLWDGQRDAVVASYFIRLRVNPEMLVPTYLWALMNSKHMKRVLFDTARGAIGQANINSRELRSFAVMLPPRGLQEEFPSRVEFVRSVQRQQSDSFHKATATLDALLARTFETAASRS